MVLAFLFVISSSYNLQKLKFQTLYQMALVGVIHFVLVVLIIVSAMLLRMTTQCKMGVAVSMIAIAHRVIATLKTRLLRAETTLASLTHTQN